MLEIFRSHLVDGAEILHLKLGGRFLELKRVDAVPDLLDAEPSFEHAGLNFDDAFVLGVYR